MQSTFNLDIPEAKIVTKPWGQEEWLALNDYYCFKKITIYEGQQTSLQYHEKKVETNQLIYGKIQIWLGSQEDYSNNTMHQVLLLPGQYVTIPPGIIHRVVAIESSILLEASSPHVDDVIRIEDDTSRPDGRIESEHGA
jgi:mannose-6-phosphate isomerase